MAHIVRIIQNKLTNSADQTRISSSAKNRQNRTKSIHYALLLWPTDIDILCSLQTIEHFK